jgi:hypothetical protein
MIEERVFKNMILPEIEGFGTVLHENRGEKSTDNSGCH